MRSEKEILDALNILKEICKENNSECFKCILRNGDESCGVIYNSEGESYMKIQEWDLKNNGDSEICKTR